MHVPVLTYHGNTINGKEYNNNDHVALVNDLELIHDLGYQIITINQLMAWHEGQLPDAAVSKAVVLTCDDGTDFDFYDIEHPRFGVQISLFNILKQHQKQTGQSVHMTNFVIASPEARIILDEKCLIGQGWWQDRWWQVAQRSGIMDIANHSWDHNHGVLENSNTNDDSFRCIADKQACDVQIKQAQQYLEQQIGGTYQSSYFAYPYGNYSEYLRHEYLPHYGPSMNLKAAFTTEPKHVTRSADTWAMPRYVCNNDWCNTSELADILT